MPFLGMRNELMNYRFIFTAQFDRDLKLLRKHNPGLRDDFESFVKTFDPETHPVIPGTSGARKARMPAKGRGKRGGYRMIYYLVQGNTIWLITIYDKVQKENLSPAEERIISQVVEKIKADAGG
jgi:mRNA-degrading endonuclease RelE of RelBE toxin-antitoxin system